MAAYDEHQRRLTSFAYALTRDADAADDLASHDVPIDGVRFHGLDLDSDALAAENKRLQEQFRGVASEHGFGPRYLFDVTRA